MKGLRCDCCEGPAVAAVDEYDRSYSKCVNPDCSAYFDETGVSFADKVFKKPVEDVVGLEAYRDMRRERNHYRYILVRLLGRTDVSDDVKSFIRTELIHKVY